MATGGVSAVPCDICDDPLVAAKFHCNTCGDALCTTCKTRHTKSKGSKHHTIVPYAEKLDPDLIAKLLCHTHQENTAEFWCDTCRDKICAICITNEHKGHELTDMSAKLSDQREAIVTETKELRDTMLLKWEETLREAKQLTANYLSEIENIEKDLAERADDLHKQVDAVLSKSREILKQISSPNLTKLQSQEKNLEGKMKRLKEKIRQYEDTLIRADPNTFLCFKPGTLRKEFELPPSDLCKRLCPMFTTGKTDATAITAMFGEILEQEDSKSLNFDLFVSSRPIFQFGSRYSCIACVDSHKAWLKTDDNTIQLIDMVDDKNIVKTSSTINDIALSTTGDIVILNSAKKSLLSKTGSILHSTEFEPCGLCCLQNGDVVVAFSENRKVIKYNSNWEIKQTYDNIKFRCPRKVAGSKVNQDIYILDHKNKEYFGKDKVVSAGDDGQLVFEYTGNAKDKFIPRDVCADHIGHILIAVDSQHPNHSLVQILNRKGVFLQRIVSREECTPNCMDVDNEGHVWVAHTRGRGGENCLEVFTYIKKRKPPVPRRNSRLTSAKYAAFHLKYYY